MMKSIFALLPSLEGKTYEAQLIFMKESDGNDVAILLEIRSKKAEESYLYELAVLNRIDIKTDDKAKALLGKAMFSYINDDYESSNDALLFATAKALINTLEMYNMLASVINERQGNCDDVIEDEIINELDEVVANNMLENMINFMNSNV